MLRRSTAANVDYGLRLRLLNELEPMLSDPDAAVLQRWFAEADARLAAWTAPLLARPPVDRRPWWVRRYWQTRNAHAGLALP